MGRNARPPKATRSVVVGLQGSGKSELAASLVADYKRVWVYDPMDQFSVLPNAIAYFPTHKEYGPLMKKEITEWVEYVRGNLRREWAGDEQGEIIVMDETSLFCPNKRPLPGGIQFLNDTHRHDGLDLMFIARRPAQIHTDLVELARRKYFFLLTGRNDHRYIKDLNEEMSPAIRDLQEFQYVEADEYNRFEVKEPAKLCRGGRGLSV